MLIAIGGQGKRPYPESNTEPVTRQSAYGSCDAHEKMRMIKVEAVAGDCVRSGLSDLGFRRLGRA